MCRSTVARVCGSLVTTAALLLSSACLLLLLQWTMVHARFPDQVMNVGYWNNQPELEHRRAIRKVTGRTEVQVARQFESINLTGPGDGESLRLDRVKMRLQISGQSPCYKKGFDEVLRKRFSLRLTNELCYYYTLDGDPWIRDGIKRFSNGSLDTPMVRDYSTVRTASFHFCVRANAPASEWLTTHVSGTFWNRNYFRCELLFDQGSDGSDGDQARSRGYKLDYFAVNTKKRDLRQDVPEVVQQDPHFEDTKRSLNPGQQQRRPKPKEPVPGSCPSPFRHDPDPPAPVPYSDNGVAYDDWIDPKTKYRGLVHYNHAVCGQMDKVSIKWLMEPEDPDIAYLKQEINQYMDVKIDNTSAPIDGRTPNRKKKTVEVAIGVDSRFLARFFPNDYESFLKFACASINNADSILWSIDVRLMIVGAQQLKHIEYYDKETLNAKDVGTGKRWVDEMAVDYFFKHMYRLDLLVMLLRRMWMSTFIDQTRSGSDLHQLQGMPDSVINFVDVFDDEEAGHGGDYEVPTHFALVKMSSIFVKHWESSGLGYDARGKRFGPSFSHFGTSIAHQVLHTLGISHALQLPISDAVDTRIRGRDVRFNGNTTACECPRLSGWCLMSTCQKEFLIPDFQTACPLLSKYVIDLIEAPERIFEIQVRQEGRVSWSDSERDLIELGLKAGSGSGLKGGSMTSGVAWVLRTLVFVLAILDIVLLVAWRVDMSRP